MHVAYNRGRGVFFRMNLLRPLPRRFTRLATFLVLCAWIATMAVLVHRALLEASPNFSSNLPRYGSSAEWRGVYYRGEKIGFTVSQTVPTDDGFELQEDGRLQMSLLGATQRRRRFERRAQVDREFAVRTFEFSLDPGTGGTTVRADGRGTGGCTLAISTGAGTHEEDRELAEMPVLPLNFARRLADARPQARRALQWTIFDPATLRNSPVTIEVGQARARARRTGAAVPAFRVEMPITPG